MESAGMVPAQVLILASSGALGHGPGTRFLGPDRDLDWHSPADIFEAPGRDGDGQDTVFMARLELLGLHPPRQAERALEAPVGNLVKIVILVLFAEFLLLLALQDEMPVLHGHLDLPGIHAGKLDPHNEVISTPERLHRRIPRGGLPGCRSGFPGFHTQLFPAAGGLLQQSVKVLENIREISVWVPSNQHFFTFQVEFLSLQERPFKWSFPSSFQVVRNGFALVKKRPREVASFA